MTKLLAALGAVVIALVLSACSDDARVASQNLSKAADNFEINRRIVFYNGITGEYMLTIEGLCSRDNGSTSTKLAIVCKVGPNEYKKHFLGLSDNVTYFIEQLEPAKANVYHYAVTFKPSVIVPDITVR
ncbi:hypothetical protein PAQ31011_00829 [Pandoraea aquatica]|uniref:Lipoprotein n=1 Tax=Pandoraea aquatica TaxID=2508290 RepID=A0A5E4SHM6_9BURK|nr:hypothetical protein [Pandoraea aquatica]VVD75167.1 hypothetical protein PAQ31011_00829 [Pandoraea aquatica]